jgi:hypothetical protein
VGDGDGGELTVQDSCESSRVPSRFQPQFLCIATVMLNYRVGFRSSEEPPMEVSWRGIHRYRLSVDVTLVRYSFLIEKRCRMVIYSYHV